MEKRLLVYIGIGAGLLSGCSTSKVKRVKANVNRPNVIFLLADDIGYGDLSPYGEPTIQTPQVERLAAAGLRFTDAHAVASTSTPSRYSLLTGHYSWRRNDTGVAAGNAGMIIRPEQQTVADLFKQRGYVTGAVGKWHLGLADKTGAQDWNGHITPGPSDIGFDYSYIMAATGDRVPCVWVENEKVVGLDPSDPIEVSYHTPFDGEPLGKNHPELLTKLHPSPNHGHDQAIVNGISRIGYMKGGEQARWEDENIADSITTKAVQFIDNNADKPFFLYLGTNDIRVPRYPHSRFVGKSGMGPRGDAILQFDYTVGAVLDALERQGIADNTLIILSSDNGPVVDDGYADQAVELLGTHRPWGDLRGGKYSNFEAGTRVPLIVSWPAVVKPGVSDALVSHIDLFASMATLVGATIAEDAAPDSRNALPSLLGRDKEGRGYVIEKAGSISIYDGEWKYIAPSKGYAYNSLTNIELGNSPEPQLYNLTRDLGERHNVATEHPDIVERLLHLLDGVRRGTVE